MEIKDIQNEREGDYGDAKEAHQAIADSWSVYLSRRFRTKIELEAKDVAILMVLFKSMREAYKHKYDNLLDLASYADFAKRFCEGGAGDTRIFNTEDRVSIKIQHQIDNSSLLCSTCYYRLFGDMDKTCRHCYSGEFWSPCNVPNEVPYSTPPDEVADVCGTCLYPSDKCTCGKQ